MLFSSYKNGYRNFHKKFTEQSLKIILRWDERTKQIK